MLANHGNGLSSAVLVLVLLFGLAGDMPVISDVPKKPSPNKTFNVATGYQASYICVTFTPEICTKLVR